MKTNVILLLIGAILGVVIKTFVDPVLARRGRKVERRERELEDADKHALMVTGRLDELRSAGVSEFGLFDPDAIWLSVLRSLTRDLGPGPLLAAADREDSDELRRAAIQAEQSWMALMLAKMDDENGAYEPAEEIEEPIYLVQAYKTALSNFTFEAHKRLV